MSDEKQRSSLFKFFYIILRVLTFPIYVVLYILKHPVWVLFFVLLGAGIVAYYPMSKGVPTSEIIQWYKSKYAEVKYDVVKSVAENVDEGIVPEVLAEKVKKEQQKMDEEKAEAKRFKGENYNAKIDRQDEFENVAESIKKRGGFKKKVADTQEEEAVSVEVNESVGGLSGILKKMETEEIKEDEVISSEVQETNSDNAVPEVVIEENIVDDTKIEQPVNKTEEVGETKSDEDSQEADLELL